MINLQRERKLLDQVNQLQRELGKVEGKIDVLEAAQQRRQELAQKLRSWWARVFGGNE